MSWHFLGYRGFRIKKNYKNIIQGNSNPGWDSNQVQAVQTDNTVACRPAAT
jgi:hypothetical protein